MKVSGGASMVDAVRAWLGVCRPKSAIEQGQPSPDLYRRCSQVRCAPTSKAVLMALALDADHAGIAATSIPALAQGTCYSVRAVQRAVKDLERAGHLTRFHSSGRGALTFLHPVVGG